MLDFLKSKSNHEESGYEAVPVDSELVEQYQESRPGRQAIRVVPDRDNGGCKAMDAVLESIHSVRTKSGRFTIGTENTSPSLSFEARYAPDERGQDHVVSLQYLSTDDRLHGGLKRHLKQQYPDSEFTTSVPEFLPLTEGMYLAGAELALRRYTLYPLKQYPFEADPSGSIIQSMVGSSGPNQADASVAVQIMCRPEPLDWTDGIPNGQGVGDIDDSKFLRTDSPSLQQLATDLREPTLEERRRLFTWETVEHPPTKMDKQVAKRLEEQRGEKSWHLHIRIFACSETPEMAVQRASQTAGQFRRFYHHTCQQEFVPQPLTGNELRDEFTDAVSREFSETGMVKSQRQAAGLCNIPKAEFVNTTSMQWSLSSSGRGIPPKTPRNSVASTDEAEQQVAMLDMTGADEPYWFGWGSKDGTEAGVFHDVLNTHQFVGGTTGTGKTTLLKHLSRQLMNRDHGCLIYDPKGMDAEDIVSLVPDHREKDLIYLEVGGDRDRSVGFNFLEPPTDAEPGEQIFVDAIESMTDDVAALLAQSSGGENQDYWGPRMDQIARNLVRGMAQAGHRCTLLDMYLALLDESGRDEYARMLEDDDRLEWLQTYAERELADMSQDDIRPVLGRLKELVENRTTREIISHPESTVSIRDAVRDGKILVVRDVASQENAGRLVATALVRRIWVAVRELTLSENTEDPPEFYCVLDEFDDIAATSSNIAQILSNARSFGLSISACCQDMSSQLDDQILNAIEGQCQTFLSFNPGRSGDAKIIAKQHSPDIDDEDLLNLSKYTFYMRTHDRENELTHSYKVDAFPPLEEISDVARSGDETEGLIQDSLETYGAPRRSDETRKTESVFWSGAGSNEWERITTETEERAVAQAVYDVSIRTSGVEPGGFVPLEDCHDAILRRVEWLDSTPEDLSDVIQDTSDLWRRAIQGVKDSYLSVQENGDSVELAANNPRATIAQVGIDRSAGGGGHALLMFDAYIPLTNAGLELQINDASGTDSDGLLRPAPASEQEYPELVERLTGGNVATIESEHQTGATKPAATAAHVLATANEDMRCLVLVRPDVSQNVSQTLLREPQFCRSGWDREHEIRYFNSPRDLTIDGEPVTRTGARENVWVRDEITDEIVLRDSDGTEFARVDTPEVAFSGLEGGVRAGETTVKEPVIPEYYLERGQEPEFTIVVVPEGAASLDDLERVVSSDGSTVPLAESPVSVDELDVSDGAKALFRTLQEAGIETATTTKAQALHSDDVTIRTIRNWLGELTGAGVVDRDDSLSGPKVGYNLK